MKADKQRNAKQLKEFVVRMGFQFGVKSIQQVMRK